MRTLTKQYGLIPGVVGSFLGSLNAEDRQATYADHKAKGDTHIVIAISYAYREKGTIFFDIPGRDFTGDLNAFSDLIIEIVRNGLWPIVMLAGDGESAPQNPDGSFPYNDPVGDTYGYAWLMANIDRIISSLESNPVGDLTKYCILVPGFDGVVPGLAAA